MNEYYWGVLILVTLACLLAGLPWLRKKSPGNQYSLSNTKLIKQRLTELKSEHQQGLLTAVDLEQAEKELKLALLDEVNSADKSTQGALIPIVTGLVLSLGVGGGVYYHSSQLEKVNNWQASIERLPELGKRVVIDNDETLEVKDLQDFALGLRHKLSEKPDDAIGWMLLGRVSGAINHIENATLAFEKSLAIEPDNTGTLASYAQALLATGQEAEVQTAKKVLFQILRLEPDNTNAMGTLAVVAYELGDRQLALDNWQRLRTFVPETDPNYAAIGQRISQLAAELGQPIAAVEENASTAKDSSSVAITVDISEELKAKLPADGFLFVFAQESTGQVRMPAAVVKMRLGTFPVKVELSNDDAMMANYTLSQLTEAKLVARISKDENVAQASGELQGDLIAKLESGSQIQAMIKIDKEL